MLKTKENLIIILILITLFSFIQLIIADEDTTSGFNELRYEGEFKLNIPENKVDEVYDYLIEKYTKEKIDWLSQELYTDTLNEKFVDDYFDTPDLKLNKQLAGLRYRNRFEENGQLEKQLIQLKITPNPGTNNTIREEFKFPIKKEIKKKSLENLDGNEFFIYLEHEDKLLLVNHLSILGIKNPMKIKKILNIEQDRKRVYIKDSSDDIIITITLDKTSSEKFWKKVSFTEIELEMNEIVYTSGDNQKREWLENINQKIKDDLMNKFPEIKQDQRPKYTKCLGILSEKIPFFKQLIWIENWNVN